MSRTGFGSDQEIDYSLLEAAAAGDEVTVKQLLEKGARISTANQIGDTALHLAARNGFEVVVEILLDNGADISARNATGFTALAAAIRRGDMGAVKLLLREADTEADIGYSSTALHIAALAGDVEVVRLLLDRGASVHKEDDFGWTPLHRAARSGKVPLLKLLLGKGADISARTKEGSTPLHIGAESGRVEAARFLIEKGADIHARDAKGKTVLLRTAEFSPSDGSIAVGSLLLERGASISARDDCGATALHLATIRGNEEMVRLLLKGKADIAATDIDGLTPLDIALGVQNANKKIVRLLRNAGTDIDTPDGVSGLTPLHSAASIGDEVMARQLLDNGAEVDAKDGITGATPLLYAARCGSHSVAQMLLEEGASIAVEDKHGTPLFKLAENMPDKTMLRLLLEAEPGFTQFAIPGDAEDRNRSDMCVEDKLAEVDLRLHHLCSMCSKMNFSNTHNQEQCCSVGCEYHIKKEKLDMRPFTTDRLGVHSLEYKHYPSLEALQESARGGCHLCSLLTFALQHSCERLSIDGRSIFSLDMDESLYGPARRGGIVLVYHISSSQTAKEELEVFYGDRFTSLPICSIPSQRCSDPDFSEAGWVGILDSGEVLYSLQGIKPLFHARCIKPNHPRMGYKKFDEIDGSSLAGYPKILNYMPGQLVSVYAVRGKLWLAAYIYGIPAAVDVAHGNHLIFGWVDSADYLRLQQQPHPSCDCGKGVWEPPLISTVGGGQTSYVTVDPLSGEAFSQIERWTSSCQDKHPRCCPPNSVPLPIRVIDVGILSTGGGYATPALSVGTGRSGRYATLSYRWGNMSFITTSSTIGEMKLGMLIDDMPQTFQDAIEVTRRLGIRYLWIDALCIIQDSPQDWQEQSAIMDQIYANAWVNISVSGGANSEGGFLKKRNLLEIRSCRHPSLLGEPTANAATVVAKVICPNIPRHDRLQSRDVLNTRGWILQERVLSRRTLHFGIHEMYWECLSGVASEREPEAFELRSNGSDFDRESQQRWQTFKVIRNGVQYLSSPDAEELLGFLGPEAMSFPCHDEEYPRWLMRNLSTSPKDRITLQSACPHYHEQPVYAPANITVGQFVAAHHLWYRLVEEYTIRSLTKPTDKLPALSGLASIFQRSFGRRSRYIAGIWSGDILNGLAWHQKSGSDAESSQVLVGSTSADITYRAPSFSWASVSGSVNFGTVRRNRLEGDGNYSAEILSVDCSPAGLNPLGEVSAGSITLKARTIQFKNIYEKFGNWEGPVRWDHTKPSLDPSNESILCISIRNVSQGYLGELPTTIRQCLLLLPSISDANSYHRVGYWEAPVPGPPRPMMLDGFDVSSMIKSEKVFSDKPPYEGWEEKVITII